MQRRNVFKSLGSLGLGAGALALAGCVTKNGSGTVTFDTSSLDKDAQAVSFLINVILADSNLTGKISDADRAKLVAVENNVLAITASIEDSSSGSITIDTSKTWAKNLIAEIQLFLSIATPIVQKYDPKVVSYLELAEKILPFIQAIVSTAVGARLAAPLTSGGLSENQIRAAIYRRPRAA